MMVWQAAEAMYAEKKVGWLGHAFIIRQLVITVEARPYHMAELAWDYRGKSVFADIGQLRPLPADAAWWDNITHPAISCHDYRGAAKAIPFVAALLAKLPILYQGVQYPYPLACTYAAKNYTRQDIHDPKPEWGGILMDDNYHSYLHANLYQLDMLPHPDEATYNRLLHLAGGILQEYPKIPVPKKCI